MVYYRVNILILDLVAPKISARHGSRGNNQIFTDAIGALLMKRLKGVSGQLIILALEIAGVVQW